jgi:hypothetical protein
LGLAEQDRALRAQHCDQRGVFRALTPCVERRAVFGAESPCLEDVFGAEGDAVERTGTGGGLRAHFDPGADFGIALGDAAEAIGDGHRRQHH